MEVRHLENMYHCYCSFILLEHFFFQFFVEISWLILLVLTLMIVIDSSVILFRTFVTMQVAGPIKLFFYFISEDKGARRIGYTICAGKRLSFANQMCAEPFDIYGSKFEGPTGSG